MNYQKLVKQQMAEHFRLTPLAMDVRNY